MKDALSGKQIDGSRLVPEGWEGECVLCQRKLKRWHWQKEAVAGLVEGPLVVAICRHHLNGVTPAEASRIGHIMARKLEELRSSRVVGPLPAARSVTPAPQTGP